MAANRPAVTRRRELAHTSARSLLMTVLGEYVLPRQDPVWTSSLVDALALFKVEEKSARQALARASGEGWLKSERAGRRVRWVLTPPGRRLLSEGAERIYGFGRQTGQWDRTWLVLLVSVPESQRDLRHRMRTRLSWAGFGSPAPGVWISPNTAAEAEAARLVAELTDGGQAMSFVASYAEIGDEQQMVARAWDLRELEHHYERFIDEFTGLAPRSGEAVLLAQTRLVHEWRRFPFLDPDLPRSLLPDRWSGTQAAELFLTRHAEWRDEAQQHWDSFVESGD
ncbi:PaaX family transcriptional regulator [Amycolatopsis rhabdoformis]|uniref:PaaX family transcriptional regulator n=1 Tax=Amycolatopsis rhabdoformis TaxID=1448059 RepID=UPI003899676C